jgi:PncC family amidohydrolase
MTEPLEVIVGQLLLQRKLTMALAESCTGGLVGHRLTDVPGSSAYLLGGIVAYSYDAKELLLGVQHNTLYDHGAVSAETAVEMARGARRALGADIGLSVTGIAGPGGGLPGKPVGLVYSACQRVILSAWRNSWDKDRRNKWASASGTAMLRDCQRR